MLQAYHDWSTARTSSTNQGQERGQARPVAEGLLPGSRSSGRDAATDHMTKVKPPRILVAASPSPPGWAPTASPTARSRPTMTSDRRRPRPRRRPDPTPAGRAGPRTRHRARSNGGWRRPAGLRPPSRHIWPPRPRSGPSARLTGRSASQPSRCTMTEPRSPRSRGRPQRHGHRPGTEVAALRRDRPIDDSPEVDDELARGSPRTSCSTRPPKHATTRWSRRGSTQTKPRARSRLALDSPYFRGADHLRNRLKKRDWLLGDLPADQPAQPRVGHHPPAASPVARAVPRRVLQHQPAGHHHRDDGRLARPAEVEPRLLRSELRRPRDRGPVRPERGRQLRGRAREVPQEDHDSPSSSP